MTDADIVVLHTAPVYAPTVQPLPWKKQQHQHQQHRRQRYGYSHVSARRCGVVQIISGAAVIITTIVIMATTWTALPSVGLIAALVFIGAGGAGVHASHQKRTCGIIGCLVLSVVSCFIVVLVFLPFLVGGAASLYAQSDAGIAMHLINVLVASVVFVVSVIQVVVSSRTVCCRIHQQPQDRVVYTVATKDESLALKVENYNNRIKPVSQGDHCYIDGKLTNVLTSLPSPRVAKTTRGVSNGSPQVTRGAYSPQIARSRPIAGSPVIPRPNPIKKAPQAQARDFAAEDDQPLIAGRELLYPNMPQ